MALRGARARAAPHHPVRAGGPEERPGRGEGGEPRGGRAAGRGARGSLRGGFRQDGPQRRRHLPAARPAHLPGPAEWRGQGAGRLGRHQVFRSALAAFPESQQGPGPEEEVLRLSAGRLLGGLDDVLIHPEKLHSRRILCTAAAETQPSLFIYLVM